MPKLHLFILGCCLLTLRVAHAQLSFDRMDTVKVKETNRILVNPWEGGFNCPQFSAIDLDGDGTKDLFAFDRHTGKIHALINEGIKDSSSYIYAPEYVSAFPEMHEWALLADYNCDGKADVFTYSNAGIAVYRNDYTAGPGLKFTLVTQLLLSKYGSYYANLFVSPVDIPAIADVDNDGDLDVLTFGNNSSTVEYHKNLSIETYGICDSLTFQMIESCWGHFSEDALSNSVTFGVSCKGVTMPDTSYQKVLHTGSTLLAYDADGDGDKELALGDVSYNNMVLLTNGGSPVAANMVAQDANFPSGTPKVNIQVFPAGFLLDADNDTLLDLLAAPNASGASQNMNSAWLYTNTGTNQVPVFVFKKPNFLQDEMIDVGEGSVPVFFDYNADGLQDLVIGNYQEIDTVSTTGLSSLVLYANTGSTTQPAFELVTKDYLGLSSMGLYGLYPAFGDLDGDGDQDLILGEYNGLLHYFTNTAGAGNPAMFILSYSGYKSIDVGQFSAPQIVDVNRDGKPDLLIGEAGGNLNYYQNTGTVSVPDFALVTNTFGKVDVRQYGYVTGYSSPFLFEDQGVYRLLCGSQSGYLYLYDNIDGNLGGTFARTDTMFEKIQEGFHSTVSLKDITGDGLPEMICGNTGGGAVLFLNTTPLGIHELSGTTHEVRVFPNPSGHYVTLDGRHAFAPDEKLSITVRNVPGQQVLQRFAVSAVLTLDVSSLPGGMYFCEIRSDYGKVQVVKFIIQR